MIEIVIDKDSFDFEHFSNHIINFLSTRVSDEIDPSSAISVIEELGENGKAEYGPESGWDNFLETLQKGKLIFFPFSNSYVGEPVSCADGNAYPEKIDEDKPEDMDFEIGETDCYGYTIQLKNSTFIINSSIHFGGYMYPMTPPHVELRSDCGEFDQPIRDYIQQFIKK